MTTPAVIAKSVKPRPVCKKYGYASFRFANLAMESHQRKRGCEHVTVYRCKCGFLHIGHVSKVYGDACKHGGLTE